jgi:6-pyruvoyl-tetrahydropterin synthase
VSVSALEVVQRFFRGMHGHTFYVTVDVLRAEVNADGFVVDDVQLEALVMEWHRVNLSAHPDFLLDRIRATTESMASILAHKIHDRLKVRTRVRVQETADISAEYKV